MTSKPISVVLFILLLSSTFFAQTTEITYQGQLKSSSAPANGNFDFEFLLFDALAGTQVGPTLTRNGVAVANGIFSVKLDFGPNFPGASRFLEIHVRQNSGDPFTTLAPRQQINSAPYSIKSLSADNATQLGGVAANQYVVTTDARLSDTRPPTAGSSNYVQNGTSQQAGNFNVSGDGIVGGAFSANTVNATTQYNIGANRVLSIAGRDNLFAGTGAGTAATGRENTFVGRNAGPTQTSGDGNSFYGFSSGVFADSGSLNSFFGHASGINNTGSRNSFFGVSSGLSNGSGSNNVFMGAFAGSYNNTGNYNTAIGSETSINGGVLVNATVIGARAVVTQGNSLVLGSISGINGAPSSVNVGIGTTAPLARLDIAPNFEGVEILRFSTERPWFFRQVRNGPSTGLQLVSTSGQKAFEITALDGNNVATFYADSLSSKVGIRTTDPMQTLDVNGQARVRSIPLLPSFAQVCFSQAGDLLQCGGSSLRWKTNVHKYSDGLNILRKLNPISYNWKEGGAYDIGLAAEDVAKAAPFFAFRNKEGVVEGVRYERLNMVLINGVKEQQSQIEAQQKQIDLQARQIERLTKIVDSIRSQVRRGRKVGR